MSIRDNWKKVSTEYKVVDDRVYYLYDDGEYFHFWTETENDRLLVTCSYPHARISPDKAWEGGYLIDGTEIVALPVIEVFAFHG